MRFIGFIIALWTALRDILAALFRPILPAPAVPQVDRFSPLEGWPGTVVVIHGRRFEPTRDGNRVVIGGDRALVLSASATELRVVAGENTRTGPVEVVTSRGSGSGASDFAVLPWPKADDFTSSGAPVFFHGPQMGTPAVGVPNQPVLVVLAYPTDHDPGTPAQRAARSRAETDMFAEAQRFWIEATYGATSWNFTFSDWLRLAQEHNHYFWTDQDVRNARLSFLQETKRSAVVSGRSIYAIHLQNAFVVSDVSDPANPTRGDAAILSQRPTGVALSSSRAYVTAGGDGLHVFSLAPGIPAPVAAVPTTGWFQDVDVEGDICAVAALGDGCHVYDISDRDDPVLLATHNVLQEAFAVRVVGSRLYVGAGAFIRVLDISDPRISNQIDVMATESWVMGFAVAGGLCVAATQGSGVWLFDVSGASFAEIARILSIGYAYGVAIEGNLLCIAGGESGLLVYDIADPSAPVHLSTLLTTPAVYRVTLSHPHAYLSLGARELAVVDISDPRNPVLTGTAVLAGPAGGADPSVRALRFAVEFTTDQLGFRKGDRLYLDALSEAVRAGFNLDDYSGMVVVVNGPTVRAQSGPADQVHDEGNTLAFNETKGLFYIPTGVDWGTVAHELGHWVGMWDIYVEAHANGTLTDGSAAEWCLSGDSDLGPLWCAHQIQEIMEVYRASPPDPKVVTRTWSPTSAALDETFDIAAHDAVQNTDAGRIHVLRLVVSSGLSYYVEVRQKPVGLRFDQELPVVSAVEGAVVVTRVTDGTSISNTLERPIMLFGTLDVDEEVVDAARGLTIRAERIMQDRPLVYRVRVTWNQPVVGDPAGQFDLAITPWTTDFYETVDVWVDSSRNNAGSRIVYENHEPGDTSKPIRNGDRPWLGRRNQIYARIRNTGPMPVTDVYVTFYVNSPPGIGDNGDWATLETKLIPILPGRDPAVPGSGEVVVPCDWRPAAGEHTCLKVAVLPRAGETNVDNNSAQENVFTFDSAGASSHEPIALSTMVRSPFTVWRRVDARVRGLPPGWHAVVNHSWVWTSPKGTEPLEVIMWTDLNAPYDFTPHAIRQRHGAEWKVPPRAFIRVEGWTNFDHRYIPIGGILADIKATQKVEIDFDSSTQGEHIFVQGSLDPPLSGVPITVEIRDERGNPVYLYGRTDERGIFDMSIEGRAHVGKGVYEVQAFVTAGGVAAESESDVRHVLVEQR